MGDTAHPLMHDQLSLRNTMFSSKFRTFLLLLTKCPVLFGVAMLHLRVVNYIILDSKELARVESVVMNSDSFELSQ